MTTSVSPHRRQYGLSLVEVMIALAIVAVALAAALRASGAATNNAKDYQQRLLARWVAGNILAEAQLERPMPPAGNTHGQHEQAGKTFYWTRKISDTPNRRFRRVDIQISQDARSNAAQSPALATLSGFAVQE